MQYPLHLFFGEKALIKDLPLIFINQIDIE